LEEAGETQCWALAGNSLSQNNGAIERQNLAVTDLLKSEYLQTRLAQMSEGITEAELPSCNLWLRAKTSFSYPVMESAEDHWLVTYLLCNHANEGLLFPDLIYARYNLDGAITSQNKKANRYYETRKKLLGSATYWLSNKLGEDTILGWGKEGIVEVQEGIVTKTFHQGIDQKQSQFLQAMSKANCLPTITLAGKKCIEYEFEESKPVLKVSVEHVAVFAQECIEQNFVCLNVKRSNLRLANERLLYVDIGKDITRFTTAFFKDMIARFYLLFELGLNDYQLQKQTQFLRAHPNALEELEAFADYFRKVMEMQIDQWGNRKLSSPPIKRHPNVSVLIKACAQDHQIMEAQLCHIHRQFLSGYEFPEVILLIDSRKDAFLRSYGEPDYEKIIEIAKQAKASGLINRVLLAPQDLDTISKCYTDWFDQSTIQTHTNKGVPLFSQIWAFDQVNSRYVLQLDIDVLIGRWDLNHDPVQDMLFALEEEKVFSVGFNIAQELESEVKTYQAPDGSYVPEVRFALLDLMRINEHKPFPNEIKDSGFELGWYRSIEKKQQETGWKSLRGGNPESFYIHPPNNYKKHLSFFNRVRDLVEQNCIPQVQFGNWDLTGNSNHWDYPRRKEDLVVFISGRNTEIEKIERCLSSLVNQSYQKWGALIVDDASEGKQGQILNRFARRHSKQVTLVKRTERVGKTLNQFELIRRYITNPQSLVVVLDLDDCFFQSNVLQRLRLEWLDGAEVIFGEMYRKDKALKTYPIKLKDLGKPSAGNVWKHLRSFRKRLFQGIPRDYFFNEGRPIEHCNDFASMIPICNLANRIKWFDEYFIWHERSTPNSPDVRRLKDEIIDKVHRRSRIERVDNSPLNSRFFTNFKRVEIDITYACNLKCIGCNRSCTQAPHNHHMPVERIEQFLAETDRRKIFWESVHVMGGEPTLHPEFLRIIELLEDYFSINSPGTERKVISNGHGNHVQELLTRIPKHWIHEKSYKSEREIPWFEPFNDAPIDNPDFKDHDFSNACWIVEQCGIGMTPKGWYGCSVAGGIDRLVNLNLGFDELPSDPSLLQENLKEFCKLCGHYRADGYSDRETRERAQQDASFVSESWRKVYRGL